MTDAAPRIRRLGGASRMRRSALALVSALALLGPGSSPPVAAWAAAPTDLEIAQTAAPSPVAVGGELTWTITVSNLGPGDASGVEANSNFNPNEVTTEFVSLSATQGSCEQLQSTFNCKLGDIPAGGAAVMTLTVKVLKSGTVGNTGDVTAGSGDTFWENNHVTDTVAAGPAADISVEKTAAQTSVRPGDSIDYSLTVQNRGPSTANEVVLTDLLPAGLVDARIDPDADCSVSVAEIACELGSLSTGASVEFSLSGTVETGFAEDSLANTATVTSTSPDIDFSNNEATAVVGIETASADVSVSKSLESPGLVAGDIARYRILVANLGPSEAEDVALQDALPALLADATASTELGECSVDAGTVSCSFGAIPAGAEIPVLVTASVQPDAAGSIANTAAVSASTPDPDLENNSSTTTDSVAQLADVSIAKTSSANQVGNGKQVVYTLTVRNSGPSDAPNTVVRDVLPAHLQYVDGSCDTGTGGGGCGLDGGDLVFDLGDVANGATHELVFAALVSEEAPDEVLRNTASVTHDAEDPEAGNDTASHDLNVDAAADLMLTKTAASSTVTAGGAIGYTLEVHNAGPGASTNLLLTDALPAEMTDITVPQSCSLVGNALECALAELDAGESWTVSVTGRVDASTPAGLVRNTARVVGDDDPTLSNNVSTAVVSVRTHADLAISKEADETVTAGTETTYTITVSNAGPSQSVETVVVDRLPVGTAFVAGGGDAVQCAAASIDRRLVRCAIGTLDVLGADGPVSFPITVAVGPAVAPGTVLVNTASVSSSTPGLSDGLVDSASSEVVASADLSVLKSVAPDSPVAGGPIAYTIRVRNAGPSSAASVELEDSLPEGVRIDEVSANAGACGDPDADGFVCSRDSLAPGATWIIVARGEVDHSATGALLNRAEVGSGTPDPDERNNVGTVSASIGTAADLLAGKWTPTPSRVPGQTAVFVLSVHNAGPSTAREVVVSDALPAGLGSAATSTTECAVSGGGGAGAGPGTVTCEYESIPAHGTRIAVVTATVDADAAESTVTNTVTVGAETADPNSANDSASAAIVVGKAVVPGPSPGPSPGGPGDGLSATGAGWDGALLLPLVGVLLLSGLGLLALPAVRRRFFGD